MQVVEGGEELHPGEEEEVEESEEVPVEDLEEEEAPHPEAIEDGGKVKSDQSGNLQQCLHSIVERSRIPRRRSWWKRCLNWCCCQAKSKN